MMDRKLNWTRRSCSNIVTHGDVDVDVDGDPCSRPPFLLFLATVKAQISLTDLKDVEDKPMLASARHFVLTRGANRRLVQDIVLKVAKYMNNGDLVLNLHQLHLQASWIVEGCANTGAVYTRGPMCV
ncbi:hypothetical protein HAX54_017088 [Datura stramonium]|uniref:Uncharacterized protein n=1 Tax=Datura stramonium TaxID=4076 RepID=A0ABS8UK45_DATST|nr:hypothetical protein [Datura stramonium]